jgi:polysaccharide biosynthesis transport protein
MSRHLPPPPPGSYPALVRTSSLPAHMSWPQAAAQVEPPGAEHVSPFRLLAVLREYKWMILGITLAVSATAVFAISRIPATYEATSLVMIDTRKASFRDLQATVAQADVDAVGINTQVEILRSHGLADSVVQQLHLTDNPEFRRAVDARPLVGRLVAEVKGLFSPVAPPKPLTPYERQQATTGVLMNRVSILNDGRSYIITVTAHTGDPQLSAAIANAYVSTYLDFKRDLKIQAIRRANGLLDTQIAPVRERLRKAEDAVEQYREQNGLVAAQIGPDGQGGTVADQQLTQLNSQLVTAQADLAMATARYGAGHAGGTASAPEVVASPMVQQLRSEEAQLGSRVASLSESLADNNPTLQAARAALAQVRRQLGAATSDVVTSSRKEMVSAQARVDSLQHQIIELQKQVASESHASVQLKQLQSEANAARNIYQDFVGRLEQTSSQAGLQESEADQIAAAQAPIGPSGPKRTQYSALAVLVGLLAGIGAALLRSRVTQGVRSLAQLEALTGLFGLGLVPSSQGGPMRHYRSGSTGSIYVDAVENARNLMAFGQDRFRAQVILVTSAEPGEGKTTFAVSLAANGGRDGQRTLVVDCDTRQPSALRVAGGAAAEAKHGIVHDVLPGVDVFTFASEARERGAMVRVDELRQMLDQMRPIYETIVIDTPPVLAYPDAAVLAQQADGAVLVVRWNETRQAVVNSAMRRLRAYDVRMLGGVLTQVDLNQLGAAEGDMVRYHAHYNRKSLAA